MSTTAGVVRPAASPGVRGRARPLAPAILASSDRGPRTSGPPARPATPRPLTPGSTASPVESPRGVLELVISERCGRSVASRQFHEGALRVLRPHYLDDSGQVCYVVVNPGGAYLAADLFVLDVEVQEGASLLLTTQSATKVYRTPGSFAEQRMAIRLGEGARLELMPDQLIAYREAS
ncbi:MAG: Urease accessory protein UreD, partial [Pseudarthrobacter sp.]|nr:Urease accessory protein UreD [Pseudarthrobacter sp.]